METNHILKNLRALIRKASISYTNEFIWQDVELTDEFQNLYEEYLSLNNYNIEFHRFTSVITSSSSKYIFVPNQWFVIASYAVDVYEELMKYKEYVKRVALTLNKKFDTYVKRLRDEATILDKNEFILCSLKILSESHSDEKQIAEEAERLWRFVNDYSWWSGQKTIDRGDFYVSVILNMLNLVNTSQGYVAEIVSAYASNYQLRSIVNDVEGFTVNLSCNIIEKSVICNGQEFMVEQVRDNLMAREVSTEYDDGVRPKIRISENNLREIKYKSK